MPPTPFGDRSRTLDERCGRHRPLWTEAASSSTGWLRELARIQDRASPLAHSDLGWRSSPLWGRQARSSQIRFLTPSAAMLSMP